MRYLLLFAGLLLFSASGCGSSTGKVSGKVIENGQPKSFPSNSAAITFTPTTAPADGSPARAFTAVVEGDGAFQVVVSGGEVPPGTYEVTIDHGMGSKSRKAVTTRREVKPGLNDFTIDLAKPDG